MPYKIGHACLLHMHMHALLEQVQQLPSGDKCLIFSQWDDMLALISKGERLRLWACT